MTRIEFGQRDSDCPSDCPVTDKHSCDECKATTKSNHVRAIQIEHVGVGGVPSFRRPYGSNRTARKDDFYSGK